ncbi:MAG: helix-turn-helix domain-containing protein [Sulfobacillus thermotolerans]|nr:helix-turn-helix domain-containing protein [Sulfobacillus thermotolerans]
MAFAVPLFLNYQHDTEMGDETVDEERKMPKQRWDAHRVTSALHERQAKGLSMASERVRIEDSALWAAARRYYKSWAKALEASGIVEELGHKGPKEERWSRERIIAEIQSYAERGQPLYAHHMRSQNNKLVSAATYYFGSWSRALEAAGFNAEAVRASIPWSAERVQTLLQDAYASGADLRDSSARFWNRALYRAACDHFGSWSRAVELATGSQAVRAERWTKERVLALLRNYLSHGFTVKETLAYHPRLSQAIADTFGDWENVAREFGPTPDWDHNQVSVRLRRFREARGWSQADLAEAIRWPLFLVESYESGLVPVPWAAVWAWAKATSHRSEAIRWAKRGLGLSFRRRLSASKAVKKDVTTASNSPCFVVGQNGHIQFWSESLSQLTGLSRERVEGQLCADIVRTSRIDGTPYCGSPCPVRKEGLGTSAPVLVMSGPETKAPVRFHMAIDGHSGAITHWVEPTRYQDIRG